MGTARHPQRFHRLAHRRLAGDWLQDVERVVARAAQNNEEGLLLEGMYPDGSRGFAGVAVPDVRP